MKRLSAEQREWLIRAIRKRARRLRKRRRSKDRTEALRSSFEELVAPHEFLLMEGKPRTRVLTFLEDLRTAVVSGSKPVLIDFSRTEKMWSDATLLFKAELCRLLKITSYRPKISCIPPHNQKVAQVLKQTGIFHLIHHRSKVKPVFGDVVNWRSANGNEAEGRKYDEILGQYDGVIPRRLQEGLYLGITEAMTNSRQHAYIETREDGLNYKDLTTDWWMFSQEKDGRLTVVFCDLGAGIPNTLPVKKPGLWERLVAAATGEPLGDGMAIAEAVKDSASRTGHAYRGKGLKQLVMAIDSIPQSRLVILSNCGCYNVHDGKTAVFDFSDSILGTLIGWSVPINYGEPENA